MKGGGLKWVYTTSFLRGLPRCCSTHSCVIQHLLIPRLYHILVKQEAVKLQSRISPLLFNFLLVCVPLLKLNATPLSSSKQPSSRATQQGLAGTCCCPFLSPACSFHVSKECWPMLSVNDFGITLRTGGRGRMEGRTTPGESMGGKILWCEGKRVPLAKLWGEVLWPKRDPRLCYTSHGALWLWEWQPSIFLILFLTCKIAHLLTSSVSTAGCVKGRVRRHEANRIRAWTFTSLVSRPSKNCCEM